MAVRQFLHQRQLFGDFQRFKLRAKQNTSHGLPPAPPFSITHIVDQCGILLRFSHKAELWDYFPITPAQQQGNLLINDICMLKSRIFEQSCQQVIDLLTGQAVVAAGGKGRVKSIYRLRLL